MPTDDPTSRLSPSDFEFHDEEDGDEELNSQAYRPTSTSTVPSTARSTASMYHLPPSEQLRGVANRIIFSRYYILFYLVMFGLGVGTVVLSLIATHNKSCPPVAWHILEVVVNVLMVLEVGTRWVAYGKKYPLTLLNIVDLLLVLFCTLTLILVFHNPCSTGTRQEEVLDTILLVIRNLVQFLRLGHILRRSGHSLLNPPKPIDLSQARTASLALDLDLDLSDEEAVAERQLGRSLVGSRTSRGNYEPIFQDTTPQEDDEPQRQPLGVKNNARSDQLTAEDEEVWDRLG
ncbi:hypothetical protein BCR39DRAFT_494399 [Naematelia encephala]|uniref:Ion transport domain-containing protein n=1 Tax=Naematelia encephala TaxID=71784 RepID=A0A1Y2B7L2_9TREE|nr:hypothetical protein BCR39DRAFT_494399 [Naematelia encephala]